MELASPPTLALPPPAEVTPTPAPLPEEQIAGESAGPASGSQSDSPPLREQLAELLRLDMDPLLSPYNTRKIQTIAAILLSDSSLPAFERSVLECIKKLPDEVLYYRQLLRGAHLTSPPSHGQAHPLLNASTMASLLYRNSIFISSPPIMRLLIFFKIFCQKVGF